MTEHIEYQELISHAEEVDWSEVQRCLRLYLCEGLFGTKPVLSRSPRHVVIAELYADLGNNAREKLRKAFSSLLEEFEPNEPPFERDLEYLFNLLSLGATIRPLQAKERLRRWLYMSAFEGWKHGPFNLHTQLVLTSAAYDSDEQWVRWIKEILPTRASFNDCALAAYRALLQTRGPECLSLLPDILCVAGASDPAFVQSFRYLLALTVHKLGSRPFCNEAIAVLNRMSRSLIDVLTITLRLDEIVAHDVVVDATELDRVRRNLKALWRFSLESWKTLGVEEARLVLDQLLDVVGADRYRVLRSHFEAQGILRVVAFNSDFYLPITENNRKLIDLCRPFFDEPFHEEREMYVTA